MEDSVYTPGAGHSPPVLAGRDELLRNWSLTLNDVISRGRVRADDLILVGPRGVGKTVTVTAFAQLAREQSFEVVNLQPAGGRSSLVGSLLHRARDGIAAEAGPWQRARQAFERLAGVSFTVAGFGAGVSMRAEDQPETDGGDLAIALATLAEEVRRDQPRGGVLVTIDEIQGAAHSDLVLFAAALHRLNVDHKDAPVTFAGTGLPNTAEALRKAGVTHPDRLFDLQTIPLTLDPEDARFAIVEPARAVGVTWDPEAATAIARASNGYPAHLQLFADAAWTAAKGPDQITTADIKLALPRATAEIERRSLGPRWDRMTGRQMELLAALALHNGRATTATLAHTLGRPRSALSWIRDELLEEGDVYVPRYGELAMAVPLFGHYIVERYEHARDEHTQPLLSLEDMRANTAATAKKSANESGARPA
jgi:hypothetical protein